MNSVWTVIGKPDGAGSQSPQQVAQALQAHWPGAGFRLLSAEQETHPTGFLFRRAGEHSDRSTAATVHQLARTVLAFLWRQTRESQCGDSPIKLLQAAESAARLAESCRVVQQFLCVCVHTKHQRGRHRLRHDALDRQCELQASQRLPHD
jgi:hypothetical protein